MALSEWKTNEVALARREAVRTSDLERYKRIVEIRLAEAKIREFHSSGEAWGSTHCADGQEAVSVGLAAAARPTDPVWLAHRVHGLGLALGCSLESVLAENLGRATGSVGGIGGSFHLTEMTVGLIHSFTIIGTQMAQAVGGAYAAQVQGSDRVSIAHFGDGAVNIGVFHESLNLAKVWDVPIVFLLENNHYAEFTRVDEMTPISPLAKRADSYDIPWSVVDGQDVNAVRAGVGEAIDQARSGGGPRLVEAITYRYLGHSRSDPASYRPEGEAETWAERDPIKICADYLLSEGLASETDLARLRDEANSDVEEAAKAALAGPRPELEAMFKNVWAP